MVSIYLKLNWIDAMNNMVAKLWIIQLNDINYGMNRNMKFKDRSNFLRIPCTKFSSYK